MFEYFTNTLEQEIVKRQPQKRTFTEQELWYLIEMVASGARYLKNNKAEHGDLSLKQIAFTEEGFVKIYDNILINPYSSFVKAINGDKTVHLSEEQMQNFFKKNLKGLFDEEKNDVYALGISILSAAALINPCSLIYNYSIKKIMHDQIDNLLNQIVDSKIYSLQLASCIQRMLLIDYSKRFDFSQINDYLLTGGFLQQNYRQPSIKPQVYN